MSTILRYIKLAEEATYAADPAPAPQITMDIASSTIDTPADTQAVWEGGIGRARRTHRPGFYSPGGNFVVAADVHTVAYLLKWALGGYQFTADTPTLGTNLHEFYGVDDTELPSFAVWLGKDVFEQVVHGCVASQLVLEVSDGYAQVTVDVLAAQDEKGVLDTGVISQLPLPPPMTFPDMQFWVGGTTPGDEVSAAIQELKLTVNNNGDAGAARGLGSRYPRRKIPVGARDVMVEFTAYYDGTEHIERLWGDPAGPSDNGSTELPVRILGDSGTDGSLQIDLPRCIFTQVETQPSGRDRIDQKVTAAALQDTVALEDASTVESEIYARLHNDQEEVLP